MTPSARWPRAIRLGLVLLLTISSGVVGRARVPDPPIAAWAFEEATGTTAADMTGNGHTATLVNGVAWTPDGKFGVALDFDGSNDGVTVPAHAALDDPEGFGISLWVAPDDPERTRRQDVRGASSRHIKGS